MDLISTRTIELGTLALDGLSARHKAISSNIANADTPGYKRVDVTFEDQLGKFIQSNDAKEKIKLFNSLELSNPDENELNSGLKAPLSVNYDQSFFEMSDFEPQSIESNENEPNLKGNTVNIEQEMSYLAKNGMTYDAIAALQAKAFRGLGEIIRSQG